MSAWRKPFQGRSAGAASGVLRGMATLAMGAGLARLISVAAIPLLTRLYRPEDYGVLSVFTSIVLMLVPLLTLRYAVAIPLPRHDGLAINLMALSALLMIGMSGVAGLVLWAFAPALLTFVSMAALAPYWWVIVLGLVGSGSYELLSMWATRRRAYHLIARTQLFQSVVGALVKIALGLLAFGPLGLLLGQVVAQSGGSGSLVARFQADFRRTVALLSRRRMGFLARYYRGFPVYRLPSQFLMVFSMQAPLLFTAALFGAETTGQLGLALMALALPVNILGQAIGKAYFAEVAQLSRRAPRQILEITSFVQKRLFALGIPPALVILFWGPDLFRLLFGEVWLTAGTFASILAISIVVQFTSAPLVQVLNVFDGQRLFLAINVARTIMLVALFSIFRSAAFSAVHFVMAYSALMTLFYLAITWLVIRFLVVQSARQGAAVAAQVAVKG
ncbi:MAG: oligosaccharide flippase family protein [Candidatus Accumulibacter sp. UW20]|jgi:O-antigen/teichoic acid export membrane protein